ncbi:5-oxoprolinase subunit PxpB [Xylophilus sp. GOD-11R]|uniref:5-oxoprolinase subunit PxpB n=1 Tax=Xylophilus sp. GOD-11R TaxID=3089814 RepID=UPI00298BDC2B|nr:5-oxoprolinase subunit PxpB [Xylophilus sp. GOD-11R]WPB56274.1 5-oxoprolinase subunit PxpB [Xylophilus sp. GOD-11R]
MNAPLRGAALARPHPRIQPLGDSALRIVLGDTLDPTVNRRVCDLADRVLVATVAGRLPGVTEVLPAFAVVGVHYRAEQIPAAIGESPFAALSRMLLPLLADPADAPARGPSRLLEIPVCYGGEFGPDLQSSAEACGITPDELVRLHQQPGEEQRVYMVGFAPGNPYIGRLDPVLSLPRRATPRTSMPVGTICIANRQTVVYPITAPGGWNMIGRTPLRLFDARRAEPCLLRPGDRVVFRAIDAQTYAVEARKIDATASGTSA